MLDKPAEACIVPLVGFDRQEARDSFKEGIVALGPIAYGFGEGRFLVENVGGWHGTATALLTDRHLMHRDGHDRPVFRDLRDQDRPRLPHRAFNTLVLMSGKRSFRTGEGDMRKHEELWKIGLEPRDCYILWEEARDCAPIENPNVSLIVPADTERQGSQEQRLMGHIRRRAYGVVFARYRRALVDAHSEANQLVEMVRYATIKIEVLDGNRDRGDAVRMWINQCWSIIYPDDPQREPQVSDENWRSFVMRAATGFQEHCAVSTPELDARMQAIIKSSRRACRETSRSHDRFDR
ncbi:hypothetical protein KJ673_01890 [Patescibacteria group bacterium]|nr:hypothetical protein [Patescibacteria group bacterium]MBU4453070.1 hypothetical protein [Patescibacteria group bacterium]MCG2687845.1 hypothetical protein [Candidatus Parcubacteria bacterium]